MNVALVNPSDCQDEYPRDPAEEVETALRTILGASAFLADRYMKSPVYRDLVIDRINIVADIKWANDTIYNHAMREGKSREK